MLTHEILKVVQLELACTIPGNWDTAPTLTSLLKDVGDIHVFIHVLHLPDVPDEDHISAHLSGCGDFAANRVKNIRQKLILKQKHQETTVSIKSFS